VPAYRLEPFNEAKWDVVYRLADAAIPFDAEGNRIVINNRKSFDADRYARRHYSALDAQTGEIVGYGAIEQQADDPASFRMFILLLSGELWESVGEMLYQQLTSDLRGLNGRLVWWREYANDFSLLRFVQARGFRETDRVADLRAPLSADAAPLIAQGWQPYIRGDQQQVIIRSTEQAILELAEQSGFRHVFSYVRLEKPLA
jgi:hypothetical protein